MTRVETTYFTYSNLYKAYLSCRKHKSTSLECLAFGYNLEANLLLLQEELTSGSYRPERSVAFIVTKPKVREIFASQFRDRVVHHLLYNYLSPIYEPRFIYDSWACRPGKGTHRAMERLQDFTWQASQGGRLREAYYLQMDIKSFFTTIDKNKLFEIFQRNIKNGEILWLLKLTIFHDPAHDIAPLIQSSPSLFRRLPADKSLFTAGDSRGLPIGNLTSQFFANVYLNELDVFMKHQQKVRWYLRYVDDWVVVSRCRQSLRTLEVEISQFLSQALGLVVQVAKTTIGSVMNGIDFVGYIVRPHYTLVRRRVIWQWHRAMGQIDNPLMQQQLSWAYRGHIMRSNSHKLLGLISRQYSLCWNDQYTYGILASRDSMR